MIFEKLPVRRLPRYVSVVVNVFCCGSFSIFDIDYGVDDGDLSICLLFLLSGRSGSLAAMVASSLPSVVVELCARFAPSPLDDVSHR